MKDKLNIGVIGAGAVGGVIATLLAKNGYDVEITKPNYDGVMIDNRINLEITGAFGDATYLVPFVEGNSFTSKKDIMFLCTKANSVKNAIADTLDFLKDDGMVVGIQNVLSLDEISKVIDINKFIPLVLDWSSVRENQNEMVVLSAGANHIGALTPAQERFLPLLKEVLNSVAPTVVQGNMYPYILSRFVLYCNTSCLGAITGYKLGVYMGEKPGKKIFLELIKEQLQILHKLNITLPPYCDQLDYYKFTEGSLSGILYRSSMFKRLINQNGENISPALRQLENKQKTELKFLAEYFVSLAQKTGVNVPYNNAIAKMLNQIENGERSIILENLQDEMFLNI